MRAIDLFAGFGGFSLGARRAGVEVVYAANHKALAVHAHALNHPGTEHVCQDLTQADWTLLPDYELMLASPACPGHSTASQPRRNAQHEKDRMSAYAVLECADVTNPRTIIVENVPAFRRWRLYSHWLDGLRQLGYTVTTRVMDATLFGVPQRRTRLFILASRVGAKIAEAPQARSEAPYGPSIDWEAPGWRQQRLSTPGAQARFATAQANHGPVCLTQHVTGHPGVPLNEAIRTITTKDQWWLLRGSECRPLTVRELARGQSFPDDYGWPASASRAATIQGIGNAVPPLQAEAVLRDNAA